MSKIPIGLQLFTLSSLIRQDYAGTVKEVARTGYTGIEMAGFGNLKSAAEVKKALEDAGLKIVGNHTRIELLEKELNRILDQEDFFGNKMLTISWMPEERRKDADGWKRVAHDLTRLADACARRGFTLMYHNHSFEFEKFDGITGFEILWHNAGPSLNAQLDTYWLVHGGQDPVYWIQRLAGRVPLLHLKDMAAGDEKRFAPVGTGVIDFRAILAAAGQAGVKWHIVEQDRCYDTDPLQAVRISFENLRKMGAA